MPPTPIKAIFHRSRRHLLDAALIHLSENYYTRLSSNERCMRGKYISTRTGIILEGAVTFQQNGRHILASVTPLDLAHFEKNKNWLQANIRIPQPNKFFVTIESAIVALVIFVGLIASGSGLGAFIMSIFLGAIYFAYSVFRAEDLARELKQTPNLSLYHFLPDCRLPAHENWMVIGEEIFHKNPFLNKMLFVNLCNDEGIGLLVLMQDDKMRVWSHPKYNNTPIEMKYDVHIPQLLNS